VDQRAITGAIPEPVARLMRLIDWEPELIGDLKAMGAD